MAGARRTALPVAAGLAVGGGLVAWLLAVHLGASPPQRLVDLDVYREAGRSVLDGRDVYGHLAHPPQRLPFTYPPLAAILAVPLAWLPFTLVGWFWTVGELACTAVITWFGFRPLLARAGRWWPLALGVLAGAMQQMLPLRDELKFGQVDELLVVLCVVDCVLLSRRRAGGALVGLASAVKLTPAVLIVYLWLTGRRRAALTSVAVFAGTTLLAAALLPHDSQTFWTDALWQSDRLRPNDNTSNQSLRGMWLRAVPDHHVVLALWLASALVVAVVGYRRAVLAQRAGDEVAGVALTGLLAVLLSPVAWIHHLAWLPLVVGVVAGSGRHWGQRLRAAAVWAFFVLKVPWWGRTLVGDGVPVLGRIVQDGYGLMALVLLLAVRPRPPDRSAKALAPKVTLRHNESSPGGGT